MIKLLLLSKLKSMNSLLLFQPTRHLTKLCLFSKHTINCLMEELGMTMNGNYTYKLTAYIQGRNSTKHHSVMLKFGTSFPDEDIALPKLYWIPKLCKNPYKQRYIAGSAKCSTKPLSQIFMEFGGGIFQQTIGIPIGTYCTSMLADLFLYSYEAKFVQSLLKADKKHNNSISPTDI